MDQDDPYDDRIVKEELTITSQYENDNETMPCEVEDDDNNFAFRGLHETSKKPLKKIAYGKMKRDLARIIKNFPCLWDGNNEFYGNREKRSEAWCHIAKLLHLNVFEVKALWKKLKDTHRYLSAKIKNKRQNKFDPNDFCDGNDDVGMKNLTFLNQRNRNPRKRGASKNIMRLRMNNALPDPLDIEETSFSENPESSSISIDAVQSLNQSLTETETVPRNETTTATKTPTMAQITSSDSEKITGHSTLKHIHIWTQLEKLFEKLDEDKITDLNFVFISETYTAILEKRKNQLT